MSNYESVAETPWDIAMEDDRFNNDSPNYVEVIETVISSLDQFHDSRVQHSEDAHLWTFKYGSADVFIQLTGDADDDTFTVWSSILPLPVINEDQLMRQLMELNWMGTFEARFGLFNQKVVVVSSRSVAGLTAGEVSHLITIVASLADEYDDELRSQYPAA